MNKPEGFVTDEIYGLSFKPEKSKGMGVLLLHPITLSSGWLLKIAELFAQEGFEVWVLDLPGHGKSKGKKRIPFLADISVVGKFFKAVDFDTQEAARKILEAAEKIKEQEGLEFLVGGGFSFGGIILSRALALDKRRIFDAAFLQCYAVAPDDIKKYQNVPLMLWLTKLSVKLFGVAPAPFFAKMSVPLKTYFRRPDLGIKELFWVLGKWMEDEYTLLFMTRKTLESLYYEKGLTDPDVPVLLLRPEFDLIVGDSPFELARRAPNAQVLEIKEGVHQVFVDGTQDELKPGVVKSISQWIIGIRRKK